MKYRDEIHIAMMALVFSCAMFAIYAVVPKMLSQPPKPVLRSLKPLRQRPKLRRSVPHRKKMLDSRFILRTTIMIMTILRIILTVMTRLMITVQITVQIPARILLTRTIPISIHPLTTIMMTVPVIT